MSGNNKRPLQYSSREDPPRTPPAAGTFQQKKKNCLARRGGGCPAKSLMGYRVPLGEWPQGALLRTSRGRVAEPEGFRDSIKLDNAIMRRAPSAPIRPFMLASLSPPRPLSAALRRLSREK